MGFLRRRPLRCAPRPGSWVSLSRRRAVTSFPRRCAAGGEARFLAARCTWAAGTRLARSPTRTGSLPFSFPYSICK